ncbi:MAG: nitroreductase family deazaflavin-dependent oxidoreductase [Anaerolineae bacterium]|nr:nitroreductase family deazaflavin-dependent oxidoreductase [Anaerolineae bacterium]MCA9909624.1 nitroreductase family deazaflavin-dependent oxidoreductase [Anaerolineae bacterium]
MESKTMSPSALVSQSPRGWKRWLFRAPIVLYRLGLGWLLGGRFVLIHHIGRSSGLPRQVVVEIAGHDADSNTYYVVSGWGYKSNWYRNLMAQPDTTIQVGRRSLSVHAETLSPEAGTEVLIAYRKAHQFAANELGSLMGLDIGHASADQLKSFVRESLPVVAFRPRENA